MNTRKIGSNRLMLCLTVLGVAFSAYGLWRSERSAPLGQQLKNSELRQVNEMVTSEAKRVVRQVHELEKKLQSVAPSPAVDRQLALAGRITEEARRHEFLTDIYRKHMDRTVDKKLEGKAEEVLSQTTRFQIHNYEKLRTLNEKLATSLVKLAPKTIEPRSKMLDGTE